MKKMIVTASLLAASTSMLAMDLQYFLGAGAERGDANYKVNGSSSSGTIVNVSDDMTDTSLKLKAGVIIDKTHRISVSHANFNAENTDLRIILGNYDYLIPINNDFRLLAGVHVGNGEYKETKFILFPNTYKMEETSKNIDDDSLDCDFILEEIIID